MPGYETHLSSETCVYFIPDADWIGSGFMIICCLVYGVFWQKANTRCQAKEAARIERLRASGLLRGEKERE